MKSEKTIYSGLLKAGFSCTSKANKTEYDGSIGEYVTYMKARYTKTVGKGQIIVTQDGSEISITFPNFTERDKFLKTIKAEQAKGYIYTSNQYYWIGVRIESSSNNLTVTLVGLDG